MTTNATAGLLLEPGGRPGTENPTHLEQTVNHTDPNRRERYCAAIHDAMEPDLSLVDQEPAFQALIDRAAEAAMALADAELAVPSADQSRQFLTTLANLGITSHRLNQIRDAARLHRQQLIGTNELYAVIDADDPVPPPAVSAVVSPPTSRAAEELASLAANAGRALQDEKRHYEIACEENARLRARLADYENRITWHTTCGSCARVLDSAVQETERRERAEAELRRMAAEAQQQPECVASISGCCLRESQSETACDTEAGECVHGGRPAAEARQDEAQQCPGVETVPNRCTCDCEGCKHHCGAHQAEEEQQPDTEAPTKETGAALARYIADQPMSEIQAAIRILGWPPLRFELVDAAEPAPVQQPAAADDEARS